MQQMDGLDYEDECADYLARLGYSHIQRTAVTGDQGVDLIAERDGKRYAFQCKYYATPVGNYAVQEVYAGCAFYDCDVPVAVSNNSFTRGAIELADKIGVELWPHVGGEGGRIHLSTILYLLFHILLLAAAGVLLGRDLVCGAFSAGGHYAMIGMVCAYAACIAGPIAAMIRQPQAFRFALFCYGLAAVLCLCGQGPLRYAAPAAGGFAAAVYALALVLTGAADIHTAAKRRRNRR